MRPVPSALAVWMFVPAAGESAAKMISLSSGDPPRSVASEAVGIRVAGAAVDPLDLDLVQPGAVGVDHPDRAVKFACDGKETMISLPSGDESAWTPMFRSTLASKA